MQLLDRPNYRVGEIEIDPAANCLRRAGAEQTLRLKSFQVLLYLLEHRERLVTKEELIENIWEGAAVTDDALVQIIVDLRRALGDDSRQPRFVRTIPKAGYRFIGQVEELRMEHSSSANAGAQAVAVEIEEITSIQIEIEESIAQAGQKPVVPPALPAPAEPRRLNGKPALLAALGISLALAVPAVFYFSKERPLAEATPPRVAGKKPVAVMHFENQSGDRELDWLREGLADMLITNLSRSKKTDRAQPPATPPAARTKPRRSDKCNSTG